MTRASALPAGHARLMLLASAASVGVALTLIVVKLIAWRMTGSVALLASLADSVLDLSASLITLFAVRMAASPADAEHRFGHGKSEGVAGLAQALIVTGSALYVAFEALSRLLAPAPVLQPALGIAAMLVSLVLTAGLISFQHYVVRRTRSLAIAADAVHYRADLLTNLAVLAAIFLSTQLGWHLADPLFGLLIAAVILVSVYAIAREALDVLLDRELPDTLREQIKAIAIKHPAVLGVHDLRTRSAGTAQFIQFHLELDPSLPLAEAHAISDEVEAELLRSFPRAEVLIHADPYGLPEARDRF